MWQSQVVCAYSADCVAVLVLHLSSVICCYAVIADVSVCNPNMCGIVQVHFSYCECEVCMNSQFWLLGDHFPS